MKQLAIKKRRRTVFERSYFHVKKLCCGVAGIYLTAVQLDKMAAMWRAYTRLMERYPWGSQILQTGEEFRVRVLVLLFFLYV
jgi:hypothetical protein